ncbi:MAG: hypothetical protein KJ749_12620 [Planctomycetes bacterium]|nr:hypothetical protein [Planctomycetota bacterium]
MNEIMPLFDRACQLVEQGVPPQILDQAVAMSVVVMVFGIGLSVLGAKLAKPGLAATLAILGGAGGYAFARAAGVHPIIGAVVGAGMFGVIGALTFRAWVGVVTALVLSTVVLGAFGVDRLGPHLADFETAPPWSAGSTALAVDATMAADGTALVNQTPLEWLARFWDFATGRDVDLQLNSQLIGIGALVTGLFLGVIATRWMLILSTSILGTMLMAGGVMAFLTHCIPGTYQSFLGNPGIIGMGIGGFLVTSLILQTQLTRRGPSRENEPKSKS